MFGIIFGGIVLATFVFVVIYTISETKRLKKRLKELKEERHKLMEKREHA